MATIDVKDAGGTTVPLEKPNANGQASMANSRPVVIANDQSAVPVSAASLPLPAGAATEAKSEAIRALLAGTLTTTPAASEVHLGEVGGNSATPSTTITRPADTTAYASGDLISFSTTAATVNATPTSISVARVNAGTGIIRRVRLTTTKTGLAGTEAFRVHFFRSAPTVTNGDNGAFSVNGRASLPIGTVDVTMDRVYNDGAAGFAAADFLFTAGAGVQTLFVLLEARGAYTPISGEVFTITAEVLRD